MIESGSAAPTFDHDGHRDRLTVCNDGVQHDQGSGASRRQRAPRTGPSGGIFRRPAHRRDTRTGQLPAHGVRSRPLDAGDEGLISVLLAEDQAMVRGALLARLTLEDDIDVVADVERGDDVLPAVLATRPNVAVLDIGMPGIDCLTAAALLRDQAPTTRNLILTGRGEAGHVARALDAEVTRFLRKNAPPANSPTRSGRAPVSLDRANATLARSRRS